MIAKIKYVRVVCMKDDREKVLSAIQKCGEMMLCENEDSSYGDPTASVKVRRMEKLISGIKPYEPKKAMFADLPQVPDSVFEKDDPQSKRVVERLENLLDELSSTRDSLQKDKAMTAMLLPWIDFTSPLDSFGETAYTVSMPGTVPVKGLETCKTSAAENGFGFEVVSKDDSKAYVVVSCMKDENPATLAEAGFERALLPILHGTAKQNITNLEKAIGDNEKREKEIEKSISELAGESLAPEVMYDRLSAESEREAAPFGETQNTVYIDGWVAEDRMPKIEKAVKSVTDAYSVTGRDPLPDEEPPTVLENGRLTSQFEGITNMFNPPKYGDFDPNAVMAPWYWIIFGLMMGDVGYGLMMAVLIFAAKLIMKPKGSTAGLMNVMLYSSITTIISGVLFGSYFGETWHPLLFSPLDDPVKMLIVTLVVGVLHIFTGMITKIVLYVREGKVWDAIFDEVSWMLIISGLGMLFIPALSKVGMIVAIIGAVIVLCTAGRASKGIIGKITGGLVGLYGVTGYMSDILSYSRILALSLATGVVGMVMNMLARMVGGAIPYIGFVFALIIYIVGHVFNLALGLLSAYVHDCRLQYIEFYGKFYDGGGKIFKPFARKTKYINIKDDGGK